LLAQGALGRANEAKAYGGDKLISDLNANYQQNRGYNHNQQFGASLPAASFLNDSVFEVGSRVLMNVPADGYIAIFALTQTAENLQNCNELLDGRIETFAKSLERAGIARENVAIDLVSQVPTFDFEVEKKIFSSNAIEVPSGFELKKNVHIYYTQQNLINKILLLAAEQEIYDIVKVDFILNDVNSIYDTLRMAATEVIMSRKKTYENLGVVFDPVFQIASESVNSIAPSDLYQRVEAWTSSPIPSKTRTVERTKKNVAFYYDRVGYQNFDRYLNSEEVAPSLQFALELRVRYRIKAR